MKYLLDTNVVSETIKSRPDPHVQKWFQEVPSNALYISVLTLGEIRKGIEKLPSTDKKQHLNSWVHHHMIPWFGTHILPVTQEVADKWGYLLSLKTLPAIDSLLAATALVHNLTMVTRNTQDFNIQGLEVVNPWKTA